MISGDRPVAAVARNDMVMLVIGLSVSIILMGLLGGLLARLLDRFKFIAYVGVALIAWGAPRNQRWVVPVGAMLALPALWYGSLSMLLAVIPLTTPDERRRAWDRVTGVLRRA